MTVPTIRPALGLLAVELDIEEASGAFGGLAQQRVPLLLVHLLFGGSTWSGPVPTRTRELRDDFLT